MDFPSVLQKLNECIVEDFFVIALAGALPIFPMKIRTREFKLSSKMPDLGGKKGVILVRSNLAGVFFGSLNGPGAAQSLPPEAMNSSLNVSQSAALLAASLR